MAANLLTYFNDGVNMLITQVLGWVSLKNDGLHLAQHNINALIGLPKTRTIKILEFDDGENNLYKRCYMSHIQPVVMKDCAALLSWELSNPVKHGMILRPMGCLS